MQENPLIDNYIRWLETLKAQGAHRIAQFVAKDVRHRTPECEGAGLDATAAIFAQIFDNAQSVKIKVTDRAPGQDGFTVYLRWDRLVTPVQGPVWTMSGVSELMVGPDGKIVSIIDHWDSVPVPARKGWRARLFG